MTTNGSVLLKVGSQDQCQRLANAIATLGGTVVVGNAASDVKLSGAKSTASMFREGEACFWTSGHVAESIASEFVALLRFMLDPTRSSIRWFEAVKDNLKKQLFNVSSLVQMLFSTDTTKWSSLEGNHASRCLAALNVLSFTEAIRVGGKVDTSSTSSDERPRGTVVEYNPAISHKAEVVFDSELVDLKTVHKIEIQNLSPQPGSLDKSSILTIQAINYLFLRVCS